MDLAEKSQEWPDEAKQPQQATLSLLKEVEPLLEEVDEDLQDEAFKKSWLKFDESRKAAPDKEEGTDERLEAICWGYSSTVCSRELVALQAEELSDSFLRWRSAIKTAKPLIICCRRLSRLCARPAAARFICATTMCSYRRHRSPPGQNR